MTGKVLLIEDEPNIIEAIRFILLRDGWSVHVHSDGATAMDAVAAHAPDMVILDVMLPNRSGYDILAELRAQDETAPLPVLMLTARGQAKDREMAERLGASRFMTKPFSNAEVLASVRELAGLFARSHSRLKAMKSRCSKRKRDQAAKRDSFRWVQAWLMPVQRSSQCARCLMLCLKEQVNGWRIGYHSSRLRFWLGTLGIARASWTCLLIAELAKKLSGILLEHNQPRNFGPLVQQPNEPIQYLKTASCAPPNPLHPWCCRGG